jgi:hypothetical protein
LPYFWDQTPDTLPRPDLSPLANPTLERNLSRWARVYFGNPPGKREQAISQLLQEIKSETSRILVAEQARQESSARSGEIKSSEFLNASCPTCHQQNLSGNRFCGQCGAPLPSVPSGVRIGSTAAPRKASSPAPRLQSDGEVQWLRDRTLGSLYEFEAPARQGWKYALGVVAIALAGFGYLQWAHSHPTRVASLVPAAGPQVTAPASRLPVARSLSAEVQSLPQADPSVLHPSTTKPAEIQSLPQADPSVLHPSTTKPAEIQPTPVVRQAQQGPDRNSLTARTQSAAQTSSLPSTTPTPPGAEMGDSGIAHLRLAERYLGGSMGVRDSSEAAKLLWKAVRQQNTTAAILLSQLYQRGDGVPKSCDQARLLLIAATKRGAPQAAEQLRQLESRGCR